MYVHRIEFRCSAGQLLGRTAEFADELLGALQRNGQVCEAECSPVYLEGGSYVAIVLAPEQMSFAPELHSERVTKILGEGAALGITVTFTAVAEDSSGAQTCACHSPSGYVLFTNFLSVAPPVRCLDCFLPVPLYRFPVRPAGDFHDVICWQSDYRSCDRLQMNCTVLEKATTRQMSDVGSTLSKVGRENCSVLESLSGKPFYYYLYRANGRSVKSEMARCCPSCGQPWYLETALHSLFHYKCDQCRLLSNFAWNLSP